MQRRIVFELHGAIGAHAHCLAQCLLDDVRAERDHDDFTRRGIGLLFFDLKCGLNGIAIEVADVELEAGFVDGR